MKTKTGQTQSVSIFQSIAERLAEKLPEKTKPFFLSPMLGFLPAVARRRTVTAWLQTGQISDQFREAFYHMPDIGRKSILMFEKTSQRGFRARLL